MLTIFAAVVKGSTTIYTPLMYAIFVTEVQGSSYDYLTNFFLVF